MLSLAEQTPPLLEGLPEEGHEASSVVCGSCSSHAQVLVLKGHSSSEGDGVGEGVVSPRVGVRDDQRISMTHDASIMHHA